MSIQLDGRRVVNLQGGTNGVFAVPGDGNGAFHEQQGAARNILAVTGLTVQLDSTASIDVGESVITNDGYWGLVTVVSSPNITVAKWMHYASDREDKVPALGTGNLRAFAAGLGVLGHRRVMIEEVHITGNPAAGAAATLHIMDFRMATATALWQHTSVVGQLGPYPVGVVSRGPFVMALSNYTNLQAAVFFSPLS